MPIAAGRYIIPPTRTCASCRWRANCGESCEHPRNFAPDRVGELTGSPRPQQRLWSQRYQREVWNWYAALFDYCGSKGRWWEKGDPEGCHATKRAA